MLLIHIECDNRVAPCQYTLQCMGMRTCLIVRAPHTHPSTLANSGIYGSMLHGVHRQAQRHSRIAYRPNEGVTVQTCRSIVLAIAAPSVGSPLADSVAHLRFYHRCRLVGTQSEHRGRVASAQPRREDIGIVVTAHHGRCDTLAAKQVCPAKGNAIRPTHGSITLHERLIYTQAECDSGIAA